MRAPDWSRVGGLTLALALFLKLEAAMAQDPTPSPELDGPVTFLALGTVADAEAFADYASRATPLLEAAGGAVTARHRATESLLGAGAPGVVFAMRFEDAAALREALASEAYRALLPVRERAFTRLDLWLGPAG